MAKCHNGQVYHKDRFLGSLLLLTFINKSADMLKPEAKRFAYGISILQR